MGLCSSDHKSVMFLFEKPLVKLFIEIFSERLELIPFL